MTEDQKAELHEIRQVHDDSLARADKAFTEIKGNNPDLAQAIKSMIHVKERLEVLSETKIKKP